MGAREGRGKGKREARRHGRERGRAGEGRKEDGQRKEEGKGVMGERIGREI
jgi:hypothetical protein